MNNKIFAVLVLFNTPLADSAMANELELDDEFLMLTEVEEEKKSFKFEFESRVATQIKRPKDIILSRLSARLEVDKNTDYGRFRFDGKLFIYGEEDEFRRSKSDHYEQVREAYYQESWEDYGLTIGKQVVIWGDIEGPAVTDVLSPRNGNALFFTTLEDARMGQLSALGTYYLNNGSVDLYLGFDARANKSISSFSSFGVSSPSVDEGGQEVGIRIRKSYSDWGGSIMIGNFYDNEAVVYNDSSTLEHFSMGGISINKGIHGWLLTAEIAYKKGLAAVQESVIGEYDRLDYGLSAAYRIGGQVNWILSFFSQNWLAHDSLLDRRDNNLLRVEVSDKYYNDNLTLKAYWFRNIVKNSNQFVFDVNYLLNDDWTISGRAVAYKSSNPAMENYVDKPLALLVVKYQF